VVALALGQYWGRHDTQKGDETEPDPPNLTLRRPGAAPPQPANSYKVLKESFHETP
jgi:hypothetical protein